MLVSTAAHLHDADGPAVEPLTVPREINEIVRHVAESFVGQWQRPAEHIARFERQHRGDAAGSKMLNERIQIVVHSLLIARGGGNVAEGIDDQSPNRPRPDHLENLYDDAV